MSFTPPPNPLGGQPLGEVARERERARVSELNQRASLDRDGAGADASARPGRFARWFGRSRRRHSADAVTPAGATAQDPWAHEAQKRRNDGRG